MQGMDAGAACLRSIDVQATVSQIDLRLCDPLAHMAE
jgi:hypothetical protein